MWILSFSDYITEKFGVSEPSIQFADILNQRCLDDFIKFFESSNSKLEDHIEKISYSEIKPFIKNREFYSEFPVVGFELVYNFKKKTNLQFTKTHPISSKRGKVLSIGGWAAGFGNKNWKWYSKMVDPKKELTDKGIIIQIGIEINVNKDVFDKDNRENYSDLEDGIYSTMYHELNHALEHYQRTIKGDKTKFIWSRGMNPALTYSAINKYKFPKQIWDFWQEYFLDYIYLSEEFELRSNVQEMYFFLKKYPEKKLDDFVIYQNAKYMESFDGYNFYYKLLKKISEYQPYKGIEKEIAQKFKDMWVEVYLKQPGVKVEDKSKDYVTQIKTVIPESTLKKMTCEEFIKFWGKKFNQNGRYLKRKINKLKFGIDEI
jgi:hypothetical protein